MNDIEKTITKAQLKLEQRALKELQKTFEKAKQDCEKQISALNARKDMQNLQSIIYQKKYQDILLKQIEGVLDDLNKGQYETLQYFFEGSYSTGYIGSMYDLHNQGIPLVIPIDPKKMVTAVMTDSKLSKNYYQNRFLPENLSTLKRNIRQELTRGIASGKTWVEVAYQIAEKMNSPFDRAMRDAMRIVRTEGHRINQQGFLDASHEAKKKGADVVKQWDATLDGNTRLAHRIADGQIRELDEKFDVDGEKLDAPSIGGSAKNVCNCRCQLLQRARWSLDEDELKELEHRSRYFQLWQGDKPKDFTEFKEKYLQLPKNSDKMKMKNIFNVPVSGTDEHYQKCRYLFKVRNIEYNPVKPHTKEMNNDEIIKALAGWDKTDGSCASVAFAYIGQKLGFDVRDFRGGKSMKTFRSWDNLESFVRMEGMKVLRAKGACSLTVGNRLLKQVEEGKEYYLCVGRHASIIRKKDGVLQYLELQASLESGVGGWTNFDGNPKYTLNHRFGCTNTSNSWHEKLDFMIDLDESKFKEDEIQSLLGFINTNVGEEMKGAGGNIR